LITIFVSVPSATHEIKKIDSDFSFIITALPNPPVILLICPYKSKKDPLECGLDGRA
jgi:hypothetical protein